MAAPEGEWSAPVRSAYGWHLVRVERRTADERVPLAAVRDQVRRAWSVEDAERTVATRIAALRAGYRVEVEPAAP
jgi:parvulin-like peptidyl-prolyl isomerase